MRVAVAGGTGLIGRFVVDRLAGTGHSAVVLARSQGVDLTTGDGLDAALVGVEAVIDVSNILTAKRKASVEFFTAVARNLVAAGDRARVRHLVSLSIVGIDAMPMGYYEGKLRQEEVLLAGPVPITVQRATQFHEFAGQMLARRGIGPLAVVPRLRSQPIAAREVAETLVALAERGPLGRAPDLGGPREEQVVDMARRLLKAKGSHRLVVPLRLPGAGGKAMAAGAALPSGPGPRGAQTFEQWLTSDDARAWK